MNVVADLGEVEELQLPVQQPNRTSAEISEAKMNAA